MSAKVKAASRAVALRKPAPPVNDIPNAPEPNAYAPTAPAYGNAPREKTDWKRAIVLSEILSPPLSKRRK